MSAPGRIGFVSYGQGMILAELLGKDRWRVTVAGRDMPGMARSLKSLYEDTYQGPQDGYYGQRILRDLAAKTQGVAVFEGKTATPGEIY